MINNISFAGYKNPIKTAFKLGLIPSLQKGIYGKKITTENISVEHITPIAKGGKDVLSNTFIADRFENSKRGTQPIENFITGDSLKEYLSQFVGVKNEYFDGDAYVKTMLKRFRYLFENKK